MKCEVPFEAVGMLHVNTVLEAQDLLHVPIASSSSTKRFNLAND